jgi:TonB-dependent receptor
MSYLKTILVLAFIFVILYKAEASDKGSIKGNIKDKITKENIFGASVIIQGTTQGASTDFDGNFIIANVKPGTYSLVISYISYKQLIIEGIKVTKDKETIVTIDIEPVSTQLNEVSVVATRKTDTDMSLISSIKESNLVVNGISSEVIQRSQDKDASEVIKRIPGITVIDGRFVMVRGLSERYNSTLLNNATAPSSESDVKAFSFDVIPSSLIDNILIYKSPAPELPAEFAGAAIQIFTKNISDKNSTTVNYSVHYRSGTTFSTFYKYRGSATDFLGFDNGKRALPSDFPTHLNTLEDFNSTNFSADQQKLQLLGREINTSWTSNKLTAIPDQRFSIGFTRKIKLGKTTLNNISAINYSNTSQYLNIHRRNYTVYNFTLDQSVPDFDFIDEQYTNTAKEGILHNWAWQINENNKLEFRNILNQTGYSKTIFRNGEEYYSSQILKSYEYRFLSRTTYSGQLGGQHSFGKDSKKLNWTTGYSFANRNEPDLRRLTTIKNTDQSSQNYNQYELAIGSAASPKYAGRVYMHLNENIVMGCANYEQKFKFNDFRPELKAGVYVENKTRIFNARILGYKKSTDSTNINLFLSPDEIFTEQNINNINGIKISESSNPSDSYDAGNLMAASYVAFKIPVTLLFQIYTGVRVEKNRQTLNSYLSDNPTIPVNYNNDAIKLFPSINLSYDLTEKSQLRLSYGKTINRPEFREIAPFIFYDFELNAAFGGNPKIKDAIIHNFDLRYELYPSKSETFSAGLFYKQFVNPIEIRYVNAGSGLQYGFHNAKQATSIGAEIEMKKSFEKLGRSDSFLKYLKYFNLSLNASYIKSKVQFDNPVEDRDRPMQGQSPFIINAGLFYQNEEQGLMVSLLYNVIGKRIIAVGQPMQNSNEDIPDTYEIPRHSLDLSFSKKLGKHFQLKGGIQDILNQPFVNKQFLNYTAIDGTKMKREQETINYKVGTYVSLGISYSF